MRSTVRFVPLLAVLLAIAASTPAGTGAADKTMKRYGVRSGIIKARSSGINGLQEGSETTYFDRWGMREAKYTENKVLDTREFTLTLVDGKHTYTVDMQHKRGARTPTPFYEALAGSADPSDWQATTTLLIEEMGGESLGTETLLDSLECEKWKLGRIDATIWVWRGIILKTHLRLAGADMLIEATEAQFDVDVPEDRFALPPDVTITNE